LIHRRMGEFWARTHFFKIWSYRNYLFLLSVGRLLEKGDKIWNVRRYTLYHFWRWWPQWDQRRFEVVFDILIYIPNFLKKYFPLNSFPFIFWNQDIKWGN
jgi:hypothetical protein